MYPPEQLKKEGMLFPQPPHFRSHRPHNQHLSRQPPSTTLQLHHPPKNGECEGRKVVDCDDKKSAGVGGRNRNGKKTASTISLLLSSFRFITVHSVLSSFSFQRVRLSRLSEERAQRQKKRKERR
jgi:hypothetical protein